MTAALSLCLIHAAAGPLMAQDVPPAAGPASQSAAQDLEDVTADPGSDEAPATESSQDATPPEATPDDAALDAITAEQERDIAFHASVLRGNTDDPKIRAGAAERLLRMRLDAAAAVLDEGLRSGEPRVIEAVVAAMNAIGDPEARLLPGCVHALRTATNPIADALAVPLVQYGDRGYEGVLADVRDAALPPGERLGAVRVLSRFGRFDSIGILVNLGNPAGDAPEALRTAALRALPRLAPEDLGLNHAAWAAWWESVRRGTREDWARNLIRRYQDRIADLETGRDAMARRYVDVLRDLYRSLPVDPDQLQRLPRDLADGIPQVRSFALEHIARLLRDGTRIPVELQTNVLGRIDDPSPSVRIAAARLLDELLHEKLPATLAARLPIETDRGVTLAMLEILRRRPAPGALESILAWVSDDELGPVAVDALWRLVRDVSFSAELTTRIQEVVRERYAAAPTPALARVLVCVGSSEDQAALEPLLDGADDELRTHVAEGLVHRGAVRPLLDRAADQRILPHALEALASGPNDLQNFQRLATLQTPSDAQERWADAVRRLAVRLPASELVAADDLLASDGRADLVLRTMILSRAVTSTEDVTLEERVTLLGRLAPLLLAQNEGLRAFELLESVNGAANGPELARYKFQAALAAGRFDAAAGLNADVNAWLGMLGPLAARDRAAAIRLAEEIQRRFDTILDDTQREALGTVLAGVDDGGEVAPPESASNGGG